MSTLPDVPGGGQKLVVTLRLEHVISRPISQPQVRSAASPAF